MPSNIIVPKIRPVEFIREGERGERVIMLVDGRRQLSMGWKMAKGVAMAMYRVACAAEEEAKAEPIIMDHATLLRSGSPIGLSSNPKIQAEVAKEAAWNSDLRRYLPGGVKAKKMTGAPLILVKQPPKPEGA